MPSIAPAQATWAGQTQRLALAKYTPAIATWTGQTQVAGPNYVGSTITKPRLDRLSYDERVAGPDGMVSINFQRKYQDNVQETEKTIGELIDTVAALQLAYTEIAKANSTAKQAQASADGAMRETELLGSVINPISVLQATTDGVVTIADHNREYSASRVVSVTGATLSDVYAPGQVVRPYYIDNEQTGGAVTWLAATGETVISQTDGFHLVGAVRIPETGSPPSTGAPSYPSGYDGIGDIP